MIESRFSTFEFLSLHLVCELCQVNFFSMKQFNLYVFKSLEFGIVG